MNESHHSADGGPFWRQWNGLALFAGGMASLTLIIAVSANLVFDRLHMTSSRMADLSDPAVPAQMATTPTVPAPAPAPAATTAPAAGATYAQSTDSGEARKVTDTPAAGGDTPAAFSPPHEKALPDGKYGEVVRFGEQIFLHTGTHAARFVGNDLSCGNCHLDAGRKANSAPMWASVIHYPAYRGKTGKVDTLAARIQGCFIYSMNGKAPPQDDEIMTALQSYFSWLATGAPVGSPVEGSGYPELSRPAKAPDRKRGELVYVENCAFCHGPDGQGQRSATVQVFPPLWGPRSFNWGAGMHRISTAAAFIHANMPLGKGKSLSEQQAWDVALFMNSHERPQDPRFTGSVELTRTKFHEKDDSMYGQTVDGHVLGAAR